MVCVIFVLSLLLCAVLSQQIHLLSEEQQELFEKVHIMPVGWGGQPGTRDVLGNHSISHSGILSG